MKYIIQYFAQVSGEIDLDSEDFVGIQSDDINGYITDLVLDHARGDLEHELEWSFKTPD